MISGPRSRSGVPLDEQSALPTAPGVPWWGAVLIAVGLTTVGAVIAVSGDETNLGFSFKALYVVGCVAAVLAVRRRALFTAVAQPPLVLFGVAVIALYFLVSDSGAGLKKLVFDVALPVAKLFPLMGWTFVVVFAIGAARYWFTHPKNAGKPASSRRSTAKKATATKSESTARPRRASSPKPSMVKEDASSTAIPPRSRAGQTPRTPRPPEPRLRNPELGDEIPRRRRAAPDAPEPRRRHAESFDTPPQPGARAYRSPDGYEPTPRLRHRDLR
ncbi:DUF6542 domain-containing protein [Gordonia rubripertincta]|uniref:DUF6542 domain-containing protein n=1 Tax=Gordonia rubripertincta TaxID=36822 RepID=A0ABT4MN92_GORRU|nr:DUF6542 domain-containing protein [Gordonia rubripertincta]MCZ4548460.1 hypothetical protein [Gordonia rubripertincta]